MRLRIVNPVDTTEGHSVKVEILNWGEETKVLKAKWPSERDTGNCLDYIKGRISFTSYPPVVDFWKNRQMMITGGKRISPQPFLTIAPGDTIKIEWLLPNDGEKSYTRINTVHIPVFEVDGLYEVNAELIVPVNEGRNILLRSNAQPFVVGGSQRLPRHTTAHVSYMIPEKRVVTLDRGSLHQIQRGDVFKIVPTKAYGFQLTIIDVDAEFSKAAVETIIYDRSPRRDKFLNVFPIIGQTAVWIKSQ